jgi:LmbE family N-acetylglucosaminyl deacetylase
VTVQRPEGIERALVVTAHPDDVDFGAAATVATLTDAGAAVTYCLITDGEASGRDREMPRADMAQLRREEQTAAAKHVGVDQLVWLGRRGQGPLSLTLLGRTATKARRPVNRTACQHRHGVVLATPPSGSSASSTTPTSSR